MASPLRDPRTNMALAAKKKPGYYPDQDVIGQQDTWDEATRSVVLKRLLDVPPLRFFTPPEQPLVSAVVDCILPQNDRLPSHVVPILNYIDDRLHRGQSEGYQHVDMLPDREAYRRGLKAIDAMAQELHGQAFIDINRKAQEEILASLQADKPLCGGDAWRGLPVKFFWKLLVEDVVSAYYAHPYAWDEIGYGGPAYPRGYMRLEHGQTEPWESEERRYEWAAPADSVSDRLKDNKKYFSSGESGSGGSH